MEYKSKTNVVFCTMADPSSTKEGVFYSDLCRRFPITSSRINKDIYFMYVYCCNVILATAINNRSNKEMIRYFSELTTDLKSCKINPGLHFMDNEAPTALKMTMTIMDIN